MTHFILYQLKFTLSLIIFYSFYRLFLQKETFFILNRIYLLSSILFAALIPLISITITDNSGTVPLIMLNTINIGELGIEEVIMKKLSLPEISIIIYLVITAVFFILFLAKILYFVFLFKKYPKNHEQKRIIILTDKKGSPFSFFNYVFINKELYDKSDAKRILAHESIHVDQLHSIDIILMEIVCIFQWFNPVAWLYKKSIKEIHEYIADDGVIGRGYEKSAYQKLILKQISTVYSMGLANNFNHSLIKKRLKMMKKIKSKKRTYLKFLWAFPVVSLAMLSLASIVNINGAVKSLPLSSGFNINTPISTPQIDNDTIYKVVYKRPQYVGGEKALQEFIIKNIQYPDEAKKNNITGTVYASFVIEKDGSVSNVEIIRGIGSGCDDEVIRIVELMPNWIPGEDEDGNHVRVSFAVPVKFNLQQEKKEDKE